MRRCMIAAATAFVAGFTLASLGLSGGSAAFASLTLGLVTIRR